MWGQEPGGRERRPAGDEAQTTLTDAEAPADESTAARAGLGGSLDDDDNPSALFSGDNFAHPAAREAESVMILPQVHLRKPCYDFYFL